MNKKEEQKRLNEIMVNLMAETFEAAEEWRKNQTAEETAEKEPQKRTANHGTD